MKEKNKPFYPPKEEIIITGEDVEKVRECRRRERLLKKRGICVYLHNLTNIMVVLEKLFDLLEGKNAWRKREKLSQEECKIGKKIASYFYCVTVNRIWGDQKWNLPEKDAYTILDIVSDYFINVFDIENPNKRLEEHRNSIKGGAEDSLKRVSWKVIKIAKKNNGSQSNLAQILIIINRQLRNLSIRLDEISGASEERMDVMIKYHNLVSPSSLKNN